MYVAVCLLCCNVTGEYPLWNDVEFTNTEAHLYFKFHTALNGLTFCAGPTYFFLSAAYLVNTTFVSKISAEKA